MIKPSQYFKAFEAVRESLKDAMLLTGNLLIVEKASVEEIKTQTGIVIASSLDKKSINDIDANLPDFVHILAVGEGYYDDEDNKDVPLDSKPGDVALVGRNSVKWFSTFGVLGYKRDTIGVVTEDQVQLRFKGYNGFQQFINALNEQVKKIGSV